MVLIAFFTPVKQLKLSLRSAPLPLAAMASFRRLQQHLQGVQKLLASLKGQPCLQSVAVSQANSVAQGLKGVSLNTDNAAALNSLILEGGHWPSALAAELIEKIAEATSTIPQATSTDRTQNQDFQSVSEYFTMAQWHLFSDRSVVEDTKLDVMLDVCIGLGLRNPSEKTSQFLTMLWRLSVVGPEQLPGIVWADKLAWLHHVKSVFLKKASRVFSPKHWIKELPDSVLSFKASYPDVYGEIFSTSGPVKCPIPIATLKMHQKTFPCRNSKQPPKPILQHSAGSTDMQNVVGLISQVLQMHMARTAGGGSSSGDIPITMLTPNRDPLASLGGMASSAVQSAVPAAMANPSADVDKAHSVAAAEAAPEAAAAEPTISHVSAAAATSAAPAAAVAPVGRKGAFAKKGAKRPSVEETTSAILSAMSEKADEAKVKAKAKAKPPAKGKAKGPHGCSKCRYLPNGCSKCRK